MNTISIALSFIEVIPFSVAIVFLILTTTLLLEVLLASVFNKPQTRKMKLDDKHSLAVIVPAHNESSGIAPVLQNIQAQLRQEDRLLVVADNCTDDTADIARSLGATVVERQDTQRRGKGYALDFGLSVLSKSPPDVVVMMDADCYVSDGSLQDLASETIATGRPTQAIYLFKSPNSSNVKDLISTFAIKLKNKIRPLGFLRLGLPSLLFGTGMAFPWSVFHEVDLANGHIVEDMKLGFDLSIAGYPPLLCPGVKVMGELPEAQQATVSQRTRWEHGHLQVLQTYVPRLFWQGIKQNRITLFLQALDLSIPPLSLLVALWIVAFSGTLILTFMGLSATSLVCMLVSGLFLFLAISVAWLRFAQDELPLSNILSIFWYIFSKIPLYLKFLKKPQSKWVRTERSISKH